MALLQMLEYWIAWLSNNAPTYNLNTILLEHHDSMNIVIYNTSKEELAYQSSSTLKDLMRYQTKLCVSQPGTGKPQLPLASILVAIRSINHIWVKY